MYLYTDPTCRGPSESREGFIAVTGILACASTLSLTTYLPLIARLASVSLGLRRHPTGTISWGPGSEENSTPNLPCHTRLLPAGSGPQVPHGHGEPELPNHRPRPALQLFHTLSDTDRTRPRAPKTSDHLDQPPRVAKHSAPRVHVLSPSSLPEHLRRIGRCRAPRMELPAERAISTIANGAPPLHAD